MAGRRSARAVAAAGRARRARVRALRRMHARGSCEAIGAPFRPPAAPTRFCRRSAKVGCDFSTRFASFAVGLRRFLWISEEF